MSTIRSQEPIRVETKDGWIVVLQNTPWADTYELWIGRVTTNGKFETASVGKDGYLVMTETIEGATKGKPTLCIPGRAWDGLADALRGVVPQTDKRELDAELKATKYHLEDMRKLAKLK